MFFNIKVKENGPLLHIYHVRMSDRLILEKLFSKKVRYFFKFKKSSWMFPYYYIPKALAFELAYLFYGAYKTTKKRRFKNAVKNIIEGTWLKEALAPKSVALNEAVLSKEVVFTLKPYQKDFLKHYFESKQSRHLNGMFLAFEQGLGKTATAIALSTLINPKQTIIICPNSLRGVWYGELGKVLTRYAKNPQLREDEVFARGLNTSVDPKTARFVIVNFESLGTVMPLLDKGISKYLIVDESHSLKELKSARTKQVMKLLKTYNCVDVVLQSGTPIKGKPHELLPILVMLDKQFDDVTLKFYQKVINTEDEDLLNVYRMRFLYLAFRKTKFEVKKVLNLPPKEEHDLILKLKRGPRYEISAIKQEMQKYIKEFMEQEEPNIQEYQDTVDALVKQYRGKYQYLTKFYDKYMAVVKAMRAGDIIPDEDREFKKIYEKKLLQVMPTEDRQTFRKLAGMANNLYASALGKAIGNVYMARYREMVIDIAAESIPLLERVYDTSITKKIVILASYPEAVNECATQLQKKGFKTVTITGATADRDRIINLEKFAQDDEIQFLVGTLEILMVGFTLVESDSLVFLNQPWRWVDKRQGEDRIHRIGQVNVARIYTIRLQHAERTLSSRNNEIVKKSRKIFTQIIGPEEGEGEKPDTIVQFRKD